MSKDFLPESLERCIRVLSRLPTIGRKSAQRLAFHLLRHQDTLAGELADALVQLRTQVHLCERCQFVADQKLCRICNDGRRDDSVLCVVEDLTDVLALERSGAFRGRYHVLHGRIAPLHGMMPEDLTIGLLMDRLRDAGSTIREIIVATNPTVDGDATALYLQKLIQPLGLPISRLGVGLPSNAALEHADETTLARAFEGRKSFL